MPGRRSSSAVAALAAALVLFAVGSAGAAAPDGRYRGRLVADNVVDSGTIHFTVSRGGRRISGWRVTMNVVCASLPVRVELITQTMPSMTVGRDGRFRSVYTRPVRGVSDVRIAVSGRLTGARVTSGKIDYDVGFSTGTCTRRADWTAARLR
ncbi:hypothetical protein [Conexibacter woesei]|uniref:Uncharacterized protein n=1 Tax=Conexibacter woesei (strain DSM 14684 / CCUG 47730 / CIP 108061 / JCM 11494 / NBRC 100937 / ID131577) TaxID=469383 RepID=D3F791_CONWI|nr:hypothetical protein [Conexibacter woesei]ADB48862.1 hypothetical protein Cwoe_0426 [Conexibacter woesei DSM 14684]